MTLLICPLCRKFTPLERFDPPEEMDIQAAEVTGLGRGRGFSVSQVYSVMDDASLVEIIAHRCLDLLKLALEHGAISRDCVVSKLFGEEFQAMRSHISELESELERFRQELESSQAEIQERDSEMESLRAELARCAEINSELRSKLESAKSKLASQQRLVSKICSRLNDILEMLEESTEIQLEEWDEDDPLDMLEVLESALEELIEKQAEECEEDEDWEDEDEEEIEEEMAWKALRAEQDYLD